MSAAPLGVRASEDSWYYPLFGKDLERRIVPLESGDLNRATIRRDGLGGILFANVPPPPELEAVEIAPGYWLLTP